MFETFRQRIENWLAYRETVRRLSSLDDNDLIDMGIRRDAIRARARAQIYGPRRVRA